MQHAFGNPAHDLGLSTPKSFSRTVTVSPGNSILDPANERPNPGHSRPIGHGPAKLLTDAFFGLRVVCHGWVPIPLAGQQELGLYSLQNSKSTSPCQISNSIDHFRSRASSAHERPALFDRSQRTWKALGQAIGTRAHSGHPVNNNRPSYHLRHPGTGRLQFGPVHPRHSVCSDWIAKQTRIKNGVCESSSPELGYPFGNERLHALILVGGCEQRMEQSAFKQQAFRK